MSDNFYITSYTILLLITIYTNSIRSHQNSGKNKHLLSIFIKAYENVPNVDQRKKKKKTHTAIEHKNGNARIPRQSSGFRTYFQLSPDSILGQKN